MLLMMRYPIRNWWVPLGNCGARRSLRQKLCPLGAASQSIIPVHHNTGCPPTPRPSWEASAGHVAQVSGRGTPLTG